MCPRGVDQTCRGPQQWNLLAPKLKQKHQFFDPYARTLCHNDRYFSRQSFSDLKDTTIAFQQLAQLDTTSSVDGIGHVSSSPSKVLATIEDLPPEILAIVNQNLDEADALALGSCSELLWMHTVKHIESDHRRSTAPWAGTPLIYTGTYLTTLPSTLHEVFPDFKDAESEYDTRMRNAVGGRGRYVDRMCPARRWNWKASSSYEGVAGKSRLERWRAALSGVLGLDHNVRKRLHGELNKVFRGPTAGGWFWRDLNLKQYVKLDVVENDELGKLQVHVSKAPWLSLDMALIAQTRWSREGSRAHETRKGWNGQWAGHCFDVVQKSPLGEDWEDVTKSVTEVARDVAREKDDDE